MTRATILSLLLFVVAADCAAQLQTIGERPFISFEPVQAELCVAAPDFQFSGIHSKITALECVSGPDNVGWNDTDISKLATLANLNSLTLRGDNWSRKGLEIICKLEKLVNLTIFCGHLAVSELSLLANIPNLEYLQLSYLSEQPVSPQDVTRLLLTLDGCKKLRKLSLDGRFDVAGFDEAPLVSRLTGLRIQEVEETHDASQYDFLRKAAKLEELAFPLRINPVAKWNVIASLPCLRCLHVPYSGLPLDPVAAEFLPKCSNLEVLDCQPEIGDQTLAVFPKMTRLKALRLGQTPPPPLRLPGEGKKQRVVPNIGPIAKVASLRFLSVSSNDSVTDDFLESLARENRIEFLDVSACKEISNSGLAFIGKMTALTGLVLSKARLTSEPEKVKYNNEGLPHLGKLKALRYLSLADASVTTTGAAFLGELSELRHLDLANCPLLTGSCFGAIIRCRKLERLNLDANPWVNNLNIKQLGTLENIVELHLWSCEGLTDDSFAVFEKMSKLRRLAIMGTSMTAEGVLAFQKSRPDCMVF